MSVRYISEPVGREKLRDGDVWAPGGSPMVLFTQTALSVGASEIPVGAYSLYLIPEKKEWMLVVNKNVTAGSKYDQQQDLFRSPLEMGSLGQATKRVEVTLVHAAPKQCNMRVYWETVGVWAEFKEK